MVQVRVPRAPLGRAVATLRQAIELLAVGAPLVCGHRSENLSRGELHWLRAHRPEAIPPEVMARLNEDGTLRPEEQTSSAEPTTPAAEL